MKPPFSHAHLNGFHTLNRQGLPSWLKIFMRLLLAILVTGAVFLTLVPWIQTAHGTGSITTLDPTDRAQSINALVAGRIKKWYVREGSMVKKGDPIVEIVDNDLNIIERLESQRKALQTNLDVAKIAAETAQINLNRQEELFQKGLSSRKDYEDAKIRYKSLLAIESKAIAELNQAKVQLSRQDTQIVRAPRDGSIVRIIAGDIATTVKEGRAIATFIPSGVPMVAELYVDGIDIPLIEEGRHVRLQFEGWPVVQFSGWPSIAIGTFGGRVKVVDPVVAPNGRFRVIIEPDPNDQPWPNERFLRLGAQARGWVMLETVSVGYELWRQLNNFPPQYPTGTVQTIEDML